MVVLFEILIGLAILLVVMLVPCALGGCVLMNYDDFGECWICGFAIILGLGIVISVLGTVSWFLGDLVLSWFGI